jgi:hypothetical protein
MARNLNRILMQGLLLTLGMPIAASSEARPASLPMVAADDGGAARATATLLKGRYKKEGDNCVWDVNDSGPNQCEPLTKGRFKKEGDRCVWEMSESGPDQCTPRGGRFKKEGDRCVWTANDSGPNQCNPRQRR